MRFTCICGHEFVIAIRDRARVTQLLELCRMNSGRVPPENCSTCTWAANTFFGGAYENFVGQEPPIPNFVASFG